MSEADIAALTPEAPSREGRRRLVLLVVAGLVVLPTLVWLGVQGYVQHQAQQQLDVVVAELTRNDPGWRLDELEAARKPVPDAQNGALVVMDVKAMLPKAWRSGMPSPKPERLLDAKRLEELRTSVRTVAKPLAKARTLTNLGEGRFPNADVKDPLAASNHCTDAPDVAMLLRMQAMLLAQDNDVDGALEAALAIAGAARAIGDETRSLAQQTRLRCRNELIAALERTLAQGQPSEAVLAKLQRVLEEEEQTPCALYAALGERAACHETALAAEEGNIDPAKIFLQVRAPANGMDEAARYVLGQPRGGRLRKAHAHMLHLMTKLVDVTRLPPEEQGSPDHKLAWLQLDDDYLLFPDLDKRVLGLPGTFRRNRTVMRCAIVALAVERYRRANNHWPQKLEELVPIQLAQLPADPYSKGPIRMERRPNGVTIFSAGKDPREGEDASKQRPGQDAARLTFQLWDVAQRRQQAVENDGEEGDFFDRGSRRATPVAEEPKEEGKAKDK